MPARVYVYACMHVCLRDASSDSRRTVRGALKNSHVGLTPQGIRRDPPIHQHPADTHTLTTIWIQSDQPTQSNTKARSFAQKESPSFGNVGEFKISTSSHHHQTLICSAVLDCAINKLPKLNWILTTNSSALMLLWCRSERQSRAFGFSETLNTLIRYYSVKGWLRFHQGWRWRGPERAHVSCG